MQLSIHLRKANGLSHIYDAANLVTSITAPVGGVLAGGWVIDKCGGYDDDKGTARTLGIMLTGGSIAVVASIPASFLSNVRVLYAS
jgi:hypothetical protein